MIVRLLRVHGRDDKVVRRGAKVIAVMAAASKDCAEVLVAQGARAVLEVIEADPVVSVKTHNAVRAALAALA